MFRRADLIGDDVPPDLDRRARALGTRQRGAIEQLASRLGLPTALVTFAVAGIAHAAVRPHLGEGTPIPAWAPDRVERAVRAVLTEAADPLEEAKP
jgi:hypothetical protein